MEIIIFTIGLLVSLLIGRFLVDNLSTVFYLYRYNTEDKFLDAYETLDSSEVYDYFQAAELNISKSYNEYLILHQQAKENAWEIFSSYLRSIRNTLALVLLALAVLPLLLFQESAILFYAGLMIPVVWILIDRRLIKGRVRSFYLLVLLNIILSDTVENI